MATSGKDPKTESGSSARTQKASVPPKTTSKAALDKTPAFNEGANDMISEGDVTGLTDDNEFNPYDEVRPRVDPQQPDRSTPDRSGDINNS